MTPPEASATSEKSPQAVLCVLTLKNRSEFLALNRGRRQAMPGMVVQGRDRRDGSDTVRVGFTCSKKVGNAVARNRAKRRLREVARLQLPQHGRAGWDYALIGRANATAETSFEDLRAQFTKALHKLHGAI
ncbi:MAG: ribonuclease P protein component [Pseudomonadota bacterium]